MGILNVTPDSFSDGGKYNSTKGALEHAEKLIADGADIIDVGGESTRPGSRNVAAGDEIERVVPVIGEIVKRFDVPVSIDTSKSGVAEAAVNAGAEIINDISGLRFDEQIGKIAAKYKTGLILMHSKGEFETLHIARQPVKNIVKEISEEFVGSIKKAQKSGVKTEQICLDPGVGFGKSPEENLEIIAKLDSICGRFPQYPVLVGTSRKSFIGRILGEKPPEERINGTIATNVLSVWNGARIVRVHDIESVAEALKLVDEIKKQL
ncbi:MAG: dihydropteroate synthase [Pyrinomonadaceae bacterium]